MQDPPFPGNINPFGTKFRETLNEIGGYAIEYERRQEDAGVRLDSLTNEVQNGIRIFPAILNGAILLSNANGTNKRWKYAWEQYLPGVAASAFEFPGQGADATSANSGAGEWVQINGQRSSWGNAYAPGADPTVYTSADAYTYFAVNGAEIDNDGLAVPAPGYVSYGEKVGTGPSGSGTVSLLSIGNLADATEGARRRVIVMMWQLSFSDDASHTKTSPGGTDPLRGTNMFMFSAANSVEVTCT